ncbi:MAG: YlbF family regulator [Clostridia bacterium]|nr:YlbF family regulator [Clostridia bacterium]
MEIFELAKKLGEAIAKDHRLVEFEEAKKNYENDVELQNALKEYEVQQQALQSEMLKEEKDGFTIDAINERINELYQLIVTNASFLQLNQIQVEVNELMNEVNNTITCAITGEDPQSACTHNCATCHSKCH